MTPINSIKLTVADVITVYDPDNTLETHAGAQHTVVNFKDSISKEVYVKALGLHYLEKEPTTKLVYIVNEVNASIFNSPLFLNEVLW